MEQFVVVGAGLAGAATAWRLAVRRVLVPAFADGFTVRGMSADAQLVLAAEGEL